MTSFLTRPAATLFYASLEKHFPRRHTLHPITITLRWSLSHTRVFSLANLLAVFWQHLIFLSSRHRHNDLTLMPMEHTLFSQPASQLRLVATVPEPCLESYARNGFILGGGLEPRDRHRHIKSEQTKPFIKLARR